MLQNLIKDYKQRKVKSGGGRIITKVDSELIGIAEVQYGAEITVSLLSIYDKSEIDNIIDKELKELIKTYRG